MNKWFVLFVFSVVFQSGIAASGEIALQKVRINLKDQHSLQRGARVFMNYCSGCHSLKYMRYSSMGQALGLTTFDGEIDKDLLKSNLVFTQATVHDPIRTSMPEVDARQWFGRLPPDLSLSARERGANWLYTYLKSFYRDKSRPFGANNLLLPDLSMPNVLAPLQGTVVNRNKNSQSEPREGVLVLIEPGTMSQQQFDSVVEDLVTFLVYVSEPQKLARQRIGLFVIGFLMVFAVFAYQLKKQYWKHIH